MTHRKRRLAPRFRPSCAASTPSDALVPASAFRAAAVPAALFAAALLVFGGAPAAASEAGSPRFKGWDGPKPKIDCRCRMKGEKVELGAVRCLTRNGETVTARCEQPQNLPYWRVLRKGCDQPMS
ncbi:MAG: hypothetical protein AAGM38_03385 [Pseudomonadota bacterium]